MRSFIVVLILFLSSQLFAIKDILFKIEYQDANSSTKLLYSINSNSSYPLSLNSNIQNDSKNIFAYQGHFRVIYGINYQNSSSTKELAKDILYIANQVWQKEVNEFGFKHPLNSDNNYIDIYIANTDAYNPQLNSYISIGSSYAGYATSYRDKTPFFVINPDMSLDTQKVTIAHEFFHTIQYAYGLDMVNDDIWYKNIWFLEASAVMMEDEVFDDIDDYIKFLPYYLNNTQKNITFYNGFIEYGKMIFAKFLKETYGIEFIKKIFENYNYTQTILQDIKDTYLKIYHKNFNELYIKYATCLAKIHTCLKDSYMYPQTKTFRLKDSIDEGYYGLMLFNDIAKKYLISSNPQYLQTDFDAKSNISEDINKSGLIVINPLEKNINTNLLYHNQQDKLELKKGWNLISNITEHKISLDKILKKDDIAWIYKNNLYQAYGIDNIYDKTLIKLNIPKAPSYIDTGEGCWIYKQKDENITIDTLDQVKLKGFHFEDNKDWQLISLSSSAFDPQTLNIPIIIWHYDNEKNEWCYFSNIYKNLPFKKIELILPQMGYFLKLLQMR